MKKIIITVLLFMSFMLMVNFKAYAVDFIEYDAIESKGTYAKSTLEIVVEFSSKIGVDNITNDLVLTDSNDNIVEINQIMALNNVGGTATRFSLRFDSELDKDKGYTLSYKDVTSIEVNFDNNEPMISYTNKVKYDSKLYNLTTDTYLVQEVEKSIYDKLFGKDEEAFDIKNYIRINIVDDRDGSLVEEAEITGLPDVTTVGKYTVKIAAVDSWNNTASKEFNFEVVENPSDQAVWTNIGIISGLTLIVAGIGTTLYILKKKR